MPMHINHLGEEFLRVNWKITNFIIRLYLVLLLNNCMTIVTADRAWSIETNNGSCSQCWDFAPRGPYPLRSVYHGTYKDLELFLKGIFSGDFFYIILLLDLPFSFSLDTILLPLSIPNAIIQHFEYTKLKEPPQKVFRILEQDTFVQGVSFKAGSKIELNKNGKILFATLSENTIINGLPGKKGTVVGFFDDEKLSTITLSEDTMIQNFPIKSGK